MLDMRIVVVFEDQPPPESLRSITDGLQELLKDLSPRAEPQLSTGGGSFWLDMVASIPDGAIWVALAAAGWLVGKALDSTIGPRLEEPGDEDGKETHPIIVGGPRRPLPFLDEDKTERVRVMCKALQDPMARCGLQKMSISVWDEEKNIGRVARLQRVGSDWTADYHETNSRDDLNEWVRP